jgi:hypothetical protein
MTVPTMHLKPIAALTAPGRMPSSRRGALAAVMTAATGIGHGAATPAPHPVSSPVGTDSGILTPAARRLIANRHHAAQTAAPAKASDAASAHPGSALIPSPVFYTPGLRLAPIRSKPEAGKTIDCHQHHRGEGVLDQPNQSVHASKGPGPPVAPAGGNGIQRGRRTLSSR